MSKKTLFKCDRCAYESENQKAATRYRLYSKDYNDTPQSGIPVELCGDCYRDYLTFLKRTAPPEERVRSREYPQPPEEEK